LTLGKNRRVDLRGIAVAAVGLLSGACLFGANAFADACTDATSKYDSAFHSYLSSKFQFPEDCARVHDYFRSKREQAQSLVSLYSAAQQVCGPDFEKNGRLPAEQLTSLLDHEVLTLQTGCDLVAGVQAPMAEPPPVVNAPPVTAAPPPAVAIQPPSPPPPAATASATPPAAAPPPVQAQTASPVIPSGLQSCAVQKTLPVAPGCNADFPQRQTGAACTAADNSVGLTLQTPGAEPICCVTACARSK
jgi:hypothetical protein